MNDFYGPGRRHGLPVLALLLAAACGGSTSEAPAPTGPENAPPTFTSSPRFTTDHNREWRYRIIASDPDGDPFTLRVPTRPPWMNFDEEAGVLWGTAGWDHIGTTNVRIVADDGTSRARQSFGLEVRRGEIICDQDFGDPAGSLYILPYRRGRTYRVIQSYCPPNPAWGHHDWFAYDFDMETGDTIVASRAGRVRLMQQHKPDVGGVCGRNAENFVFVEHADGTVMQYMHLTTDGALVVVGDEVEQGQPIALSGNSGCSAGPHLHVALFRTNNYDRQSTLPFNYSNADGELDDNRGLLQDGAYTAR